MEAMLLDEESPAEEIPDEDPEEENEASTEEEPISEDEEEGEAAY